MSTKSHQQDHAKLEALLRRELFDEALEMLARTEAARDLNTSELISKGRAIQLMSNNAKYPLAAAEEAFKKALDLDPQSISALIELAWYYHSLEDDSQRALPLFERAIELSREQLTEAARGRAGCLAEMNSETVASSSLRGLHEAALVIEDLTEQEQNWLSRSKRRS